MNRVRNITALIIFYFMLLSVESAQCPTGRVSLQVLGSGGPELNDQRASTSYLIWLDNKAIVMIDAGGGSSYNFEKSGASFNDIKAIAFTHFHVDHSAEFSAYVKHSYFSRRQKDLLVFGPEGNDFMPSTSEFIDALFANDGVFPYLNDHINESSNGRYLLKPHNVSLKETLSEYVIDDELKLSATPVHHGPLAAVAWRVDIAGCSITFSGDMSNKYNTLATLAKNSDILVAHNAIPQNANQFALNLHMPPSEIGKIAKQANVKKLILSHLMNRTLDKKDETLDVVRKYYNKQVEFAEDLMIFEL